MDKTYIRLVLAGFVLMSGLVSCSPEKKKTLDVYEPGAVIFRRTTGSKEFKQGETKPLHELDLNDELDLTQTHAAKAHISSQCGKNVLERDLEAKSVFIFQVIPDETLTKDLKHEKVECGFQLKLTNDVGSAYYLNFRSILMQDEKQSPVRIENGAINYIGQGKIRLICEDAVYPDMDLRLDLHITDLLRQKSQPRDGRTEFSLLERGHESCRVAVIANGELRDLSALQNLEFPRKPLVGEVHPLPSNSQSAHASFMKNEPFVLYSFSLSNPEPIAREIAIDGTEFDLQTIFYITRSPHNNFFEVNGIKAGVSLNVDTKAMRREGQHWIVHIGPHETIAGALVYNARIKVVCETYVAVGPFQSPEINRYEPRLISLQLTRSVEFKEIGYAGSTTNAVIIRPEELILTQDPLLNRAGFESGNGHVCPFAPN